MSRHLVPAATDHEHLLSIPTTDRAPDPPRRRQVWPDNALPCRYADGTGPDYADVVRALLAAAHGRGVPRLHDTPPAPGEPFDPDHVTTWVVLDPPPTPSPAHWALIPCRV